MKNIKGYSHLMQDVCREEEISLLMTEPVTVENLMKFQYLVAKQLRQKFEIEELKKSESSLSLYEMSDFVLKFLDKSPEEYYRYSGIKQVEIDKILGEEKITIGDLVETDHLYAIRPEGKHIALSVH